MCAVNFLTTREPIYIEMRDKLKVEHLSGPCHETVELFASSKGKDQEVTNVALNLGQISCPNKTKSKKLILR